MTRLIFAAVLAAVITAAVPASGTSEDSRLRVIAGGINTRGTSMLPGVMPHPEGAKVFRIALDASTGDDRNLSHWVRNYTQNWMDSTSDPAGTIQLTVKGPGDPRLDALIAEIARTPNAVVHIDMDLAWLGPGDWRDQTPKLAQISARLAEERLRVQPASRNSIYTHSAGTMGLSHLILAKKGHLYQEKVAASPMTSKLTRDVVIVLAEGDLPSAEEGADPDGISFAARDPERWFQHGNTVIRISGRGFDVRPTDLLSRIVRDLKDLVPVRTQALRHIQASALGVRDEKVEVWRRYQFPSTPGEVPPPQNDLRLEIPNISAGHLLRVLTGDAGPDVSARDSRRTPVDQLKEHIKSLEPPKGGGIALRAAAEMPFGPEQAESAAWDPGGSQLTIRGRNGRVWRLPRMDVEIMAAAYRCLFGDRPAVPEFSIGAPLDDDRREHVAPGKSATYFRPDSVLRFSKLGFVMYQADVALGDIAYGGTDKLRSRGLIELDGFHSLPEMFPGKYSREFESRLGTADRVVIQSLPARLIESDAELAFEPRNEFAVRFGRTTPVERAYADLFAAHQQAIIQRVPEFQHLLAAARAVGVLMWIRDNNLPFEAAGLGEIATRSYETPAQVVFAPLPAGSHIRERRPLILYGEYGPVSIQPADGPPTQITYNGEHVERIVRSDGAVLEVFADDRGEPLGLQITGQGAAAFVSTNDGYAVFHDDVVLHQRATGLSFERKPGSGAVPEKNPRALVNTIAANFVAFADHERLEAPAVDKSTPLSAPSTHSTFMMRSATIAAGLIVALLAGLLIWRGEKFRAGR